MKLTYIGPAMSVSGSAWFESITAEGIWMRFGMNFMSLESTIKSYFSIPYNRYYQHGEQTNLYGGIHISAT